MAAYAALVSLLNDLELIPNHPTHSFSFDKTQISSLSQTVEFLIDFMETYDSHGCTTEAAEALEGRIASAAHAAHDVIESHVVDQIHAGSTLVGGSRRSCFLPDLQRAMEKMESVKRKAMQFKAKSGLKAEQPRYSSAPSTSSTELLVTGKKKNAMVGFDSVLLRLLDILTGEPSYQRSVVPIVGMGGIGSEWDLAEDEEFPHLKILKISWSLGLIDWNASSYNFQVLEELQIHSYEKTSKLSEIPFDFGEIPTLRLIHLKNCSASCALSAMRIAVEQENLGNQDLKLEVHFGEMEQVERFQKMVKEEGLISDSLSVYHRGNKIKAFF